MVGCCWVPCKSHHLIHRSRNRRPRAPTRHRLDSARCRCSAPTATGGYDIILSSGFLAFAAHCGFLKAVEDVGLPVAGVMGTSAGALVGSFFAAGYSADEIAEEFSRVPPIERICPSREPWTGLLSYDPAILTLRKLLPPSFEDLELEFGVGVVGGEGGHELVQKGPLAEAVAASAAVPFLFSPVAIPGSRQNPYKDGGVACRVGLELWRSRHNGVGSHRRSVVHLIGRSSPFSGNDNVAEQTGPTQGEVRVVHSPKSGASLWDLTGFEEQYSHARERALPLLKSLMLDNDLVGMEVGRLQKENVIVNP